ncbi:MAG: DUF554 domain-containing protein [Ruminococcus sp.]|nr:DUF554 domain-containing protein [Ruminococcus sp.]
MLIGVVVNSLAVLFGGAVGTLLGNNLKENFKSNLTLIFGVTSMSMGVISIVKLTYLPAVVLAVIIGTAIGELIHLEYGITAAAEKVQAPISKVFASKESNMSQEEFMQRLVSIVVLFCASGTGIFGALQSGMTGDHTILFSKSILDFFTAAIFAASLGFIVCTVCVPQFIVLLLLFFSAAFIMPMTTPEMLNDFTACGGILMLATGFRIAGIKSFPIANMLPSMVLVMPFSYLWSHIILPLV